MAIPLSYEFLEDLHLVHDMKKLQKTSDSSFSERITSHTDTIGEEESKLAAWLWETL